MAEPVPVRVGLIGLGTVGTGVAKIVSEHRERITARAGRPIEVTRVAVRDPSKPRDVALTASVGTDAMEVATAADVDVVCELVGGLEPAREFVMASLAAGKDVVTANKALLCEHGPEVLSAAREAGRVVSFEAAVAGGIPIISTIAQSMTANQITGLQAILNGTSNFILTEMLTNGQTYEDALADAQKLGYAEADPFMDVSGTDAAQKLTILSQLAFGTRATPAEALVSGIDSLTLEDLRYAEQFGFKVKLLATARLAGEGENSRLEMHTQPTLVRSSRPLANVDGADNVVEITGDAVGRVMLTGPGAGQMPTASAVVSDLIDVASGRAAATFARLEPRMTARELLPAGEIRRRYYLRSPVPDQPGTLGRLATTLGEEGISLASVHQPDAEDRTETGDVPLVVMTHVTTEAAMRTALEKLPPGVCLPVIAD